MPQLDDRLANLRTARSGAAETRIAVDVAFDGVLRRRQRRRLRRVGRAGMVLAVGVVLVATVIDRNGRRDQPITTETTAPDRTIRTPVDLGGKWEEIPPAPLSPRTGAAMVSTGDRLVVWGGSGADGPLADGAVYDAATKAWSPMAESPLLPTSDPFAAAVGDEVVVVGESHLAALTGEREVVVYNVARGDWRSLGNRVVSPAMSWSGRWLYGTQQVIWAAGDVTCLVFPENPFTGEGFGCGEQSPSFQPFRGGSRGVFAAGRAVVVSIADGKPVVVDRLDAETLEWEPTITTEMNGLDLGPEAIAVVGTKLFLIGHYTNGAVVDLETGLVEPLAMSASSARYPALTVGGVITVGDRWLDPETRAWYDAAPIPNPREFPSATTAGGSAMWWGGDACGPGASCLTAVDPGAGLSWTPPAQTDRATARGRIFDELKMTLTLAADSVESGADVEGSVEIVNDSGRPITDPGCLMNAIEFGLVPTDGSTPPGPLFHVTVDCGGALVIGDDQRITLGWTFRAGTTQGDDLAPGDYLAVIEMSGRTHRLEARIEVT